MEQEEATRSGTYVIIDILRAKYNYVRGDVVFV